MESTLPPAPAPTPPGGLFTLPEDSVHILDADEEIMELYMNRTSGDDGGGLGFLDANKGEMEMSIEIAPPDIVKEEVSGKRRGRRKEPAARKAQSISVELKVVQDPSALRSRSGETGTVLWRSSLYLAKHLLTQYYFPPPSPLITNAALSTAKVLELGAGTGVLASLLAPLCGEYTVTDRRENLRLIQRNIDANAGAVKPSEPEASSSRQATVAPLDWMDVSTARVKADKTGSKFELEASLQADLVLAVDCIYNEHLVVPLVDTLAAACANGAVAWVVVELRSSDTLTQFLDTWLNDRAGWTIVRLGESAMGRWDGGRGRWVGWIGWIG